MSSRRLQYYSTLLFLLSIAGCSRDADRPPALAEAWVGPASLNLRKELAPTSPVVGTVKHGDKVEIIQTRRRFLLVRTAGGVQGWTDNRQLLSAVQMNAIREMAEKAAQLPSRGRALSVTTLNLHAEPSRTSPTIYQIQEKTGVQVMGRKVLPRTATPATPALVVARPKPPAPVKKKESKEAARKVPPPPKPAPPKPPENWLELSQAGASEDEPEAAETEPAKPVPLDEWALVVTKEGKAGWVLGRMLSMAIPDEVAQYAEGARITSYYSLGKVMDEGVEKHHWLWTTLSKNYAPYDFDAFRVFIWSTRRRRYETAYVERGVEGILPAAVHPLEVESNKKKVQVQGFSVVVKDEDGKPYKKTFWFEPYKVKLMDRQPAPLPPDPLEYVMPSAAQPGAGPADTDKSPAAAAAESWWVKVKNRVKGIVSR